MSPSLVTGAGGFVGSHLCRYLAERDVTVRAVSSRPEIDARRGAILLDTSESRLVTALEGTRQVYFLAGIAHEAVAAGDGALMHRVNVEAPLRWLRAADRAGVERFIWLSSIKVLGDVSARPLEPADPYRPGDAYARSKVEAERRLLEEPVRHVELAVVRPPLVYGPGVRGHFRSLLRAAASGLPLPLAGAGAPRSLVAVDNLCDLLLCLGSRGDGVFHVADAEDVTVAGLVADVRRLLGRPARQFSVPPALLRAACRYSGRSGVYTRLFEPLRVHTESTCSALGWSPPRTAAHALADTVTWLQTSH